MNNLRAKIGLLIVIMLAGVAVVIAMPEPPPVYLPYVQSDNSDEPIAFGPTYTGEGTYYNATGSGACLFPATPDNLMVAAMNFTQFGDADFCGAFIEITGAKGSVIVRIVDMCPECHHGDIDMSPQAFAEIDDIPKGRVPISWQVVSYPVEGDIVYQFKDGSNQWWTAVQIRNHRNPIASVEYLNGSGNYINVPRTNYNYFVQNTGMGPGPYTFRVTDVFGNQIINSNIQHVENGEVIGSGQFPTP